MITNATFNGKTLKLKSFILKNTNNLFGTDLMIQFQLFMLYLLLNKFSQADELSRLIPNIENIVKLCKGCALAAKAPPIKFKSWPKLPWCRIHIDFVGQLEGFYYFIVVDSFSKWPEVHRCKNPTTEVTIKFLHELFASLCIVDTIVSDNGSQFTLREFEDFCESYQIDHITTAPFHLRSNRQAK